MLGRLLVRFLRPYWPFILLVVLFQAGQSIASLWLPSLNADIIDQGVAQGDTGYVLQVGGVMLLVTLAQIVCAIIAVYFGARTAMAFGRDVRGAIFDRVGAFSEREVQQFGAPSLITRT
ncbi:MAG: ABC transporter ATP-binding protein, partial [Microthrixaceae bacterium]|nr:ABC transporter ATP-binding protein [Microthrixaceae bacterium]